MPLPTAGFYFDLGSPLAYIAAERVMQTLPGPAEWRPVLASELGGTSDLLTSSGQEPAQAILRSEIERRALELGMQPMRWPKPFPFDSELAMLAATYAKSIGRLVPFAQAAFRQAFAGGHALQSIDFVLIAGAACEMHPSALKHNAALRSVAAALAARTAQARDAGVTDVPAVLVADEVFLGERRLEDAAAAMNEHLGTDGAPR